MRQRTRLAYILCLIILSYLGILLKPLTHKPHDGILLKSLTHKPFDVVGGTSGNSKQAIPNTTIEDYIKEPDFMQIQTNIQRDRIQNLQETCKIKYSSLADGQISKLTQQHIYVNHKIKGIYCYIPKVACSNWKRIMMVLNGYPKEIEDITGDEAHNRNGLTLLSSLPDNKKSDVLAKYTKFMVVREPFLRLLSAYKNKFEQDFDRSTNKVFKNFAKMIMKRYRQNPTRIDILTGRGVRWDEFVSYLTDPTQITKFESHWQEMYKLCSPCKINYDYIIKLETLEDDSKFIFESFNVSHLVKVPAANVQKSKPSNSSNKYLEYYKKLSSTQINKLWNIYKRDFELFNYTKPDFVK